MDLKGVKVYVSESNLKSAPCCCHGPTILFEKEIKRKLKKFYACSASRDRKYCNFYWLVEENGGVVNTRPPTSPKIKEHLGYDAFLERMEAMKQLDSKKRKFCCSCGDVVDKKHTHKNHNILEGITNEQLDNPFCLIKPNSTNETKAQYSFATDSIELINEVVTELNVKGVLCIGTPSLHHKFKKDTNIESFLLDIDERLVNLSQFLYPSSACHYNMFNHHFFNETSKQHFLAFITSFKLKDLVIIVDPPYGGLVELIMHSINLISKQVAGDEYDGCFIKTLLVFPYFIESKICKNWNNYDDYNNKDGKDNEDNKFHMVDCQIEYIDHKRLKKRSSHGESSSIVRLFSNIPPQKVKLPSSQGYKFCEACKKYVSRMNKHCVKCDACTTKVGARYKHCHKCQRCVKATWTHCDETDICKFKESSIAKQPKRKKIKKS